MKVLLIDVNYKYSSTGKIVYNLYSFLNESGETAAVCYGRGPDSEDPGVLKFGLDWETCLHAALTRLTGLTGCYSFFSTKRLLRFINQFRPDVIHLHEPHAYFLNLKPFFSCIAASGIPLVYTMHCEFAYTGKCGHAMECEKWMSGCGKCPRLREYPQSLFFDFTGFMQRQKRKELERIGRLTIVTPSKWLAERVSRSFLNGRDIRVIHNSIDTETLFHPYDGNILRTEYGITQEKIVLALAPDIMSDAKGGEWVLKLAERFRDESVRFVLVGVADMPRKWPENVLPMAPVRDQEKLARIYSAADVFVICSRRENFPTTCLEAVCCGTPIAGFNTGGTAETVPEPLGLFGSYGDLDALEAAVRKLFAEKIPQERYDRIRAYYHTKRMCGEYLALYRACLQP